MNLEVRPAKVESSLWRLRRYKFTPGTFNRQLSESRTYKPMFVQPQLVTRPYPF